MSLNRISPLVQKPVMMGANEGEVIETRLAPLTPMNDVMGVNKSLMMTARVGATAVTGEQRPLDAGRHGSLLATDTERLPIASLDKRYHTAVTTQSAHGGKR